MSEVSDPSPDVSSRSAGGSAGLAVHAAAAHALSRIHSAEVGDIRTSLPASDRPRNPMLLAARRFAALT